MGLYFGSCFLKLFLKIVFKNIKNIILILSKNCSYYPDLIFFIFFIFFRNKKKTLHALHVFLVFHTTQFLALFGVAMKKIVI